MGKILQQHREGTDRLNYMAASSSCVPSSFIYAHFYIMKFLPICFASCLFALLIRVSLCFDRLMLHSFNEDFNSEYIEHCYISVRHILNWKSFLSELLVHSTAKSYWYLRDYLFIFLIISANIIFTIVASLFFDALHIVRSVVVTVHFTYPIMGKI
jgi:hypothetical protein